LRMCKFLPNLFGLLRDCQKKELCNSCQVEEIDIDEES